MVVRKISSGFITYQPSKPSTRTVRVKTFTRGGGVGTHRGSDVEVSGERGTVAQEREVTKAISGHIQKTGKVPKTYRETVGARISARPSTRLGVRTAEQRVQLKAPPKEGIVHGVREAVRDTTKPTAKAPPSRRDRFEQQIISFEQRQRASAQREAEVEKFISKIPFLKGEGYFPRFGRAVLTLPYTFTVGLGEQMAFVGEKAFLTAKGLTVSPKETKAELKRTARATPKAFVEIVKSPEFHAQAPLILFGLARPKLTTPKIVGLKAVAKSQEIVKTPKETVFKTQAVVKAEVKPLIGKKRAMAVEVRGTPRIKEISGKDVVFGADLFARRLFKRGKKPSKKVVKQRVVGIAEAIGEKEVRGIGLAKPKPAVTAFKGFKISDKPTELHFAVSETRPLIRGKLRPKKAVKGKVFHAIERLPDEPLFDLGFEAGKDVKVKAKMKPLTFPREQITKGILDVSRKVIEPTLKPTARALPSPPKVSLKPAIQQPITKPARPPSLADEFRGMTPAERDFGYLGTEARLPSQLPEFSLRVPRALERASLRGKERAVVRSRIGTRTKEKQRGKEIIVPKAKEVIREETKLKPVMKIGEGIGLVQRPKAITRPKVKTFVGFPPIFPQPPGKAPPLFLFPPLLLPPPKKRRERFRRDLGVAQFGYAPSRVAQVAGIRTKDLGITKRILTGIGVRPIAPASFKRSSKAL